MKTIDYIKTAQETMKITQDGYYFYNGGKIDFPVSAAELKNVIVYSPQKLETLKNDFNVTKHTNNCNYSFEAADSFEAAKKFDNALVMNFANAHCAGGGFLAGASAQEEALCRCSTLYASISSGMAKEMYRFNTLHPTPTDSHYMLISPEVYVFRSRNCELIGDYFKVGVVTVPAPNKFGKAALASKKAIEKAMTDRIRYMLLAAIDNGYKNIVLGAWGCGAFGNNINDVAMYFYNVLEKESFGLYFDNVVFAVIDGGKKLEAFKNVFCGIEKRE